MPVALNMSYSLDGIKNNRELLYEGCFGFHQVANAKESRLSAHSEPTRRKNWSRSVTLSVWLSKGVTLSHIVYSP